MALVGNPNSGKTTLFNHMTGSNQYVGNWPGVTVEKKKAVLSRRKSLAAALHWSIFRVFILCRHIPWRKLLRGIM